MNTYCTYLHPYIFILFSLNPNMHTPFPFKHILIHIHDIMQLTTIRYRYCILALDKCSPALHFYAYFSKAENYYTSAPIIKVSRDDWECNFGRGKCLALSELIQRDSSTEGIEALLKQKANIDIFKGKLWWLSRCLIYAWLASDQCEMSPVSLCFDSW